MKFTKNFLNITIADFIVRSAYQMGKTPLLPIFAATLGASGAFLGVIISVSTLTGLVLKPFIGILSDRWGRRVWLLIGTVFFIVMPFLYGFVQTPQHLFIMRIIHGLSTAIYGPVTLAYIAELKPKNIAESLGWFGLAREGGYIVGPALAGWLLLWTDPVVVFTIIGLISMMALIPVLNLQDVEIPKVKKQEVSFWQQSREAFKVGVQTPSIWLAGVLESGTFVALYALKAFLPIFALQAGISVVLVGLFFSVQEGIHILIKPFGGRIADKLGHLSAIMLGMVILAVGLALLPLLNGLDLFASAILIGGAQAFIFSSTIALVSQQITHDNLGAGMGFIGTMQNLGKIIGPVLGGLLIQRFDFEAVLYILAILLVLGAILLPLLINRGDRRMQQHPQVEA
ncbi:MAG: MFS transporter [Anaerolineae bacterium]|nr:MFS transporter [Anaerolineae bacterium]